MPVHAVYEKGRLVGYQWGQHGKVYRISVYGKARARRLAGAQGAAAHAAGFRGK